MFYVLSIEHLVMKFRGHPKPTFVRKIRIKIKLTCPLLNPTPRCNGSLNLTAVTSGIDLK